MHVAKLAVTLILAAALAAGAFYVAHLAAETMLAGCGSPGTAQDAQRCDIFSSGIVPVIAAAVVFVLVIAKSGIWAKGNDPDPRQQLLAAVSAQSTANQYLSQAINTLANRNRERSNATGILVAAIVIVVTVLALAWAISRFL